MKRPELESPVESPPTDADLSRRAGESEANLAAQSTRTRLSSSSARSLQARQSGRRWRLATRWVGLLVFVLGASLLAYSFLQALHGFQQFTQPDSLSSKFNRVAGDGIPAQLAAGIIVIGAEVLRVLYLLLLGYFGSAIAAKGIQFFAASDSIIDEAIAAGTTED